MVVYISMAFGNPYNDFWDAAYVEHWVDRLYTFGVDIFSMSDTVGVATPDKIRSVFSNLSVDFPKAEFGAHFHTLPDSWEEKLEAALEMGCRRFDGALKGFGGCPMAKDDLVGNMPTEKMIDYLAGRELLKTVNRDELEKCMLFADGIFK